MKQKTRLTINHQPLIIGIDGNEANVGQRVGSNQYAFELLHALHDLPEAREHHWIIYLREPPIAGLPRVREGWKYKVFGPKRFWTQFALPLSLFLGKPPDIFFTPGHYRPRWSPVPTVISVMDLGYLRFPQHFTKKDLLQLTRWTARGIKKADHIIAISESTKKDIMHYYKIPSSKITVTYPGYDKSKFKNQISKIKIDWIKRKYKISGNYILFLGTLKPSKNVEGLLDAFKLIINHPPAGEAGQPSSINLVIGGKKGWMYESIFEKVKKLGLEDKQSLSLRDKVIFTDFIPDEEVPVLMAAASVFVLPSFWEGFGIPVIEAMATGVPVVVSNVGSLPEVVGEVGILVNPKDPKDIARGIKEALLNYDALSKKGIARAKQFSWQKTAKQTLGVLETVSGI